MITEPTSSVFILRRDRERGWMTALVWHPRLECWLPAGGHVEENETAAQCGIREALEETGLDITLVPGPAVPVPFGFPHRQVPAPWLVAEVPAAPDRHTRESHVHADHVYVAIAAAPAPCRDPEHQVRGSARLTSPPPPPYRRTPGSWPPGCWPSPPRSQAPGFQWPPETRHGTPTGRPAA